MNTTSLVKQTVLGEFVTIDDERYYAIKNVDKMETFLISLVSHSDHWLFISSNGALTAGRKSADTALFPYDCVDKIYDDALNTGSKTLLRIQQKDGLLLWEPFNQEHTWRYSLERNLYKNTLGNKICFEEINHTLGLTFRCSWHTSDRFGFVRTSELVNNTNDTLTVDFFDGLQNVLPAGTPKFAQTVSSNLVDAYKWNEVDSEDGLALFTLYSAITDRAEPCESLRATTLFSIGLHTKPTIVLSNRQLSAFRQGKSIQPEFTSRGVRGAYFVSDSVVLDSNGSSTWQLVANVEQTQSHILALKKALIAPQLVAINIQQSIAQGDNELASILARADGFQLVNEEVVGVHHYANTLFNVLRGGIFNDQYAITKSDFTQNIKHFNVQAFERHAEFFNMLAEKLSVSDLLEQVQSLKDPQLERLATEYLPIYFGRRHGDPSRPWNQFLIKLKDEQNKPLLTYQGNWRDIFQNWEALAYSYPDFIEGMIAKFVNASTVEGYNPYRITKEGIDWEVEEPDDPWSYIGYWGDHQIIYLLKLLELSKQFHPQKLASSLHRQSYCYANVPYKIKPFVDLLKNAKDTVKYDVVLAHKIEQRVELLGADGKLILDKNNHVYQVNLLEKLLVPLLGKLGNLVVDGGIWLNTQRPEWNDANNALVGQGLSMVTLNYLRRYLCFMQALLNDESDSVTLSSEVAAWLDESANALEALLPHLNGQAISPQLRYQNLCLLGEASSRYRSRVYHQEGFSSQSAYSIDRVKRLLKYALVAVDHTISTNKREDGLYHAYNLLELKGERVNINYLSPMLEGQVAALSSGALDVSEVSRVVDALFASDIYRPDQKTFMLYPDRVQTPFMQKNCVSLAIAQGITSLQQMIARDDQRLIIKDADNNIRFHADIANSGHLLQKMEALTADYSTLLQQSDAILELYEQTFNHQAFTGRSGGMFGFEGLGSIYWHMVSKLLLAVAENVVTAANCGANKPQINSLVNLYYRIREGIGFNKKPDEYGAFPTDPYSHTPKHAGAQQPGMTGQVKEELITRFHELGIHIISGSVVFNFLLLRKREFLHQARDFRYLDTSNTWQTLAIKENELAFTWCQVPVVYKLNYQNKKRTTLVYNSQSDFVVDSLTIASDRAQDLFKRTGVINHIIVEFDASLLFDD
jgi:hypothetical protein